MTSLGVLYDFTGNDVNTTVQTVAKMVKEDWVSLPNSGIACCRSHDGLPVHRGYQRRT